MQARNSGKINLVLDSGAHSLYEKMMRKNAGVSLSNDYAFVKSPEFWEYVDNYSKFVKENAQYIDHYVSVDIIFEPELSYKVQKYMEDEHGLSPMPVYHYGEDLKWLARYIDEGYDYIGIGGLGQGISSSMFLQHGDAVFNLVCDTPDRMPCCKTHGFAVTALPLLLRYPWYSVDSTTWVMLAGLGVIIVPYYKNGKYIYDRKSMNVIVSSRSEARAEAGKHFDTLSPLQQELVVDYAATKGFVLGESAFRPEKISYELKESERWSGPEMSDGTRDVETVVVDGLRNNYKQRRIFNALYFRDLEQALPKWPWAFKTETKKKGFGL